METKASIKRQQYKEEVRHWLDHHSQKVAKTVSRQHNNRQFYHDLLQNLSHEHDPKLAALVLIEGGIDPQSKPPENDGEESLVGAVIKHQLHKEIGKDSIKSIISPAVVLTERRRKHILESLKNGGFSERDSAYLVPSSEYSISQSSPTNNSSASTKDDHSFHFDGPVVKSKQAPYKPRWEDYSTMQTRWKYILPQTKLLHSENTFIMPRRTTSSSIDRNGVRLQGTFNDITHFETQRAKSPSFAKTLARSAQSNIMTVSSQHHKFK